MVVVGDRCLDKTTFVQKSTRANPENPDAAIYTVLGNTETYGMADNVFHALKLLLGPGKVRRQTYGNEVKHRIIDNTSGEQLFRCDSPSTLKSNSYFTEVLCECENADIVVISDYCKGALTDQDIQKIIALGKLTFIDTKKTDLSLFDSPNVWLKINSVEYSRLQRQPKLLEHARLTVTVGAYGSWHLSPKLGEAYTHSGFRVNTVDVCGAGDMFLAGLVYGVITNNYPEVWFDIANACAAISVTRHGVFIPSIDEVKEFLKDK